MTESSINKQPAPAFSVLLCVATLLLFAGAAGCEKKPTGYETKSVFVDDAIYKTDSGDVRDKSLDYALSDGWEVIGQRRAWSDRYGSKRWGTEYTLRRPTYD